MSQVQHGNPQPEREPKGERKGERKAEPAGERELELVRAQDLLTRTLRFLEHCAQDPLAALAAENPRELIRELEALRATPQPETDADADSDVEPRTIPLRRRRSA
jgi:hypothetical protein